MTPPKLLEHEARYQKSKRSTGPLYAMGGAHPKALKRNKQSGDLGRAADAMWGLATGAKGNEREQDIHTPDCVLAVARATFDGVISCDPCASLTRSSFATLNIYDPTSPGVGPDASGGLGSLWPRGTFFNPPYKNLKDWLEHAVDQPETIGLYPVRTNREWWCAYHAECVDVIAWLKPLKFDGFLGAFPAPLVLVYHGHRADAFVKAVKASQLAHSVTGPLVEL